MAYEGFGIGGVKRPKKDRNSVNNPGAAPYDNALVDAYKDLHSDKVSSTPYGSQSVRDYINTPRPKKRKPKPASTPTPPSMVPFIPRPNIGAINQAKRETKQVYQQANRALMADLDAARAEVMRQYKLSRTKSEKQALKRQLRDLENQKKAAAKAIDKSYQQAATQIDEAAKANETMAGRVADRTAEFWERAAASQQANTAQTQTSSEAGSALGVGGMSIGGDVTAEAGFSSRQGARDAARQLDLGRIAAAEQRALASSVAAQEAARQGELQRAALGIRSDAIQQSFDQSNARIAQERAQRAAALQQLRDLGISGRQANLSSMADVALDAGMQRAQMQSDWANAVAQAQAADAQAAYESGAAAGGNRDLVRQQNRFVANHPAAPGLQRLREMNAPYSANGYGVMPSNSRTLAAEVEGLLRSQAGLPQGERRMLALEWLNSMEGRYGPNFLLYLNNVGGITQSHLGL